uniref:ENTH domain-containing protein n=1 Tax=Arcella intermedia TaxID=1963864 RepID=A0A6B2L355_9EUKA
MDTVMKVPESVRLVKTATNNEHWGPSGTQMRQVADLTFNYTDYPNVMQALWERLTESTMNNWRNIYKALLLLDYLLKNGSERVVNDCRQNSYQVKALQRYHFIDEEGTDRGLSVRERSKHITDLLQDTEKLRDERKKAKINRDKYNTAISNADPSFGRRHDYEEEDPYVQSYTRRTASTTYKGNSDYADDDDFDFRDKRNRRTSASKRPTNDEDEWEQFEGPKSAAPVAAAPRPSLAAPHPQTPFPSLSPSVAPLPGPAPQIGLDDIFFNPVPAAAPAPVPSTPAALPGQGGVFVGSSTPQIPPGTFSLMPSNPPVQAPQQNTKTDIFGGLGGTTNAAQQIPTTGVPQTHQNPKAKNEMWDAHKHLFNLGAINDTAKPAAPGKALSSTVGTGNVFTNPPGTPLNATGTMGMGVGVGTPHPSALGVGVGVGMPGTPYVLNPYPGAVSPYPYGNVYPGAFPTTGY